MTKMSTLPRDLAEEILSKVPVRSLREVQLTCKNWNNLSKEVSFQKKHLNCQAKVATREIKFLLVMLINYRVCLTSVNLHKNVINPQAKLLSLDNSDQILVREVFHCDGLLLCTMKDKSRLVVWNPYTGQTRWINVPPNSHRWKCYNYSLGYERSSKSCLRNYKILRCTYSEYQLYDLNSDSWKVLDVTLDKYIQIYFCRGISVHGNTYWFPYLDDEDEKGFLVCFDFAKENFGPQLPLPFECFFCDIVTLSSIREGQLAVLLQRQDTLDMEIWVTNTIEPNTVSWSSKFFLAFMNMVPLSKMDASFFIHEEKKVAVIINYARKIAHIVGVDGSMEETHLPKYVPIYWHQLVCSYVPSLEQLN